jgi:predicted HicB family RNase H-like nuclease
MKRHPATTSRDAQETDNRNLLKPLNFRVPATFHKEFKVYASQNGISMVELLERSFRNYQKILH